MPVTLPDSSYFDNDNDSIKDSRPELKKMADAINTIGAEYNAGTLGGSGIQDVVAGDNVTVTNPDSAGSVTISATGGFTAPIDQQFFQTTSGSSITPVRGNNIWFVEIGLADTDSSGTSSPLFTVNWDNFQGNEYVWVVYYVAMEDGGGSVGGIQVNHKRNGTLLSIQNISSTANTVYHYNTVVFPSQTQYGDNYNVDVRLYGSTFQSVLGSW